MHRLTALSVLSVGLFAITVACGAGSDAALDTLPPIRTTTTMSTTTTTIDPREIVYIVQPGDNLNEIARAYEVTAARIVELNGLANNGETIQPGQELKIPNIRVDVTLPTPSGDTTTTNIP